MPYNMKERLFRTYYNMYSTDSMKSMISYPDFRRYYDYKYKSIVIPEALNELLLSDLYEQVRRSQVAQIGPPTPELIAEMRADLFNNLSRRKLTDEEELTLKVFDSDARVSQDLFSYKLTDRIIQIKDELMKSPWRFNKSKLYSKREYDAEELESEDIVVYDTLSDALNDDYDRVVEDIVKYIGSILYFYKNNIGNRKAEKNNARRLANESTNEGRYTYTYELDSADYSKSIEYGASKKTDLIFSILYYQADNPEMNGLNLFSIVRSIVKFMESSNDRFKGGTTKYHKYEAFLETDTTIIFKDDMETGESQALGSFNTDDMEVIRKVFYAINMDYSMVLPDILTLHTRLLYREMIYHSDIIKETLLTYPTKLDFMNYMENSDGVPADDPRVAIFNDIKEYSSKNYPLQVSSQHLINVINGYGYEKRCLYKMEFVTPSKLEIMKDFFALGTLVNSSMELITNPNSNISIDFKSKLFSEFNMNCRDISRISTTHENIINSITAPVDFLFRDKMNLMDSVLKAITYGEGKTDIDFVNNTLDLILGTGYFRVRPDTKIIKNGIVYLTNDLPLVIQLSTIMKRASRVEYSDLVKKQEAIRSLSSGEYDIAFVSANGFVVAAKSKFPEDGRVYYGHLHKENGGYLLVWASKQLRQI